MGSKITAAKRSWEPVSTTFERTRRLKEHRLKIVICFPPTMPYLRCRFPPFSDNLARMPDPVKVKLHPDLIAFYGKDGPPPSTPIQDQIRLLAMRGTVARAGGVRTGQDQPTKYIIDPIDATQAAKYLAEAFEYGTPKDGSVFWSGVDAGKLVKQVNQWNKEPGSQGKFGQLEATTDARFLNGAFKYDSNNKGVNEKFWENASHKYGHGALGHVTAVQVFGLKEETIFWKLELPAILNGMKEKLKQGMSPDVVDLTIVVIDPVGERVPAICYTNLDIGRAPVYVPKPGLRFAGKRDDCVKVRQVGHAFFPIEVRKYWAGRGSVPASSAALRLAANPSAVRY